MVMSWVVATLLLGPDDGSIERDEIEVQIQGFIVASFAASDRPEKGELPPHSTRIGVKRRTSDPMGNGRIVGCRTARVSHKHNGDVVEPESPASL